MKASNHITSFHHLLLNNEKFGIYGSVITAIISVSVVSLSIVADLYLFVLPILIALPLMFLVLFRPKVWMYVTILSMGVFFHASDDGVGAIDVLLGAFYLGSIVIWFVKKVLIEKEKVVENWGDWAILAFFSLLLLNFLPAVFNEVEPMNWLREYLLVSIYLIYFPVRDILKKEKDITGFLLAFGFVVLIAGAYQSLEYYQKVNTNLVYAYELKSAITINQTLYTAAAIFAFILAFSQRKKVNELFVIALTSIYIVYLISTFSRTFWLILGASIILMFFLLPATKKILFMTYLGVIAVVLFLAAALFMKGQAELVLGVAFTRFESTSEGKKDISLIARFAEWEELYGHIVDNPLGGNGLAKSFSFYFPINLRSRHTTTIHNGYLWLAYRTGIPLSLLFLFFIGHYNIRAGKLIAAAKDQKVRAVVIASFAILLSLYIINFTSAQYFTRDGMMVTAMTIALIGASERIIKRETYKEGNA
ncbi:hypothetical protein MASR1M45_15030 [Candidatus Kapaibacterium sp.]